VNGSREWSRHTPGGDGTFSLVIYRKGQPPEYHLELKEEQLQQFI